MPNVGPTANLPGTARRRGRSGTAWRDSKMLGEVTAVERAESMAVAAALESGSGAVVGEELLLTAKGGASVSGPLLLGSGPAALRSRALGSPP